MDIVIKAAQFLASFSLLVLIHELGHFIFARMFGVKVEKFYLFFNPWFSLVKFTYKGTEYGIGWVPFGGYCKIAGMIDESMDTESLKEPPKPWEFRSKPAWQRLLVMVGGVLMNIVLAVCIYIGMNYAWGEQYLSNSELKDGSTFNALAQEIGFCNGDRILRLNGEPVEDYHNIYPTMVMDMPSTVEVMRGGVQETLAIDERFLPSMVNSADFMLPRLRFIAGEVVKGGGADRAGVHPGDRIVALDSIPMEFYDQYLAALPGYASQTVNLTVVRDSALLTLHVPVNSEGKIGLGVSGLSMQALPFRTSHYSFFESIPAGFRRAGDQIAGYGKQLRLIANPKSKAYKSVGGVGAIASLFPASWSWYGFWSITAFLSIVLAIMNIIPLPVLDGGHVMFLLWEVVTGRKPSDKFLERATAVGLLIVFAVLLLANGNDIYRFLIK